MIVKCCECQKIIREKEGGEGVSHTWCEKCVVGVKKELWLLIHETGLETHYHPWATDDGKFFIYESEQYRGGVLWTKKMVCKSVDQAEDICRELNGG